MKAKHLTMTPADASLTGFASNVTGATFTLTANSSGDSLAHQVSIRNDTANNHAGKTIALVGTGPEGNALTESVTGPGPNATVESSGYFLTLTSATPSATIGADTFDIGWVDEFASAMQPLDRRNDGYGLSVYVTGTINYTVQNTMSKIQDSSVTVVWLSHDDADFVTETTSKNGNYRYAPLATRIIANSYSSGATLQFHINPVDPR